MKHSPDETSYFRWYALGLSGLKPTNYSILNCPKWVVWDSEKAGWRVKNKGKILLSDSTKKNKKKMNQRDRYRVLKESQQIGYS